MSFRILSLAILLNAGVSYADLQENGPGSGGCPTVNAAGKVSDAQIKYYFSQIGRLNAYYEKQKLLKECFMHLASSLTLDQALEYVNEVVRVDDSDESDYYANDWRDDWFRVTAEMISHYAQKNLSKKSESVCLEETVRFAEVTDDWIVAPSLKFCVSDSINQLSFKKFETRIRGYLDLSLDSDDISKGITDSLITTYLDRNISSLNGTEIGILESLASKVILNEPDFDDYLKVIRTDPEYIKNDIFYERISRDFYYIIFKSRFPSFSNEEEILSLTPKAFVSRLAVALSLPKNAKAVVGQFVTDIAISKYLEKHMKTLTQAEIKSLQKLASDQYRPSFDDSLIKEGIHCPTAQN